MCSRNVIFKFFLRFILSTFCFLTPGYASGLTLQWDANSEANLAGYNLYYDIDSGAPYDGMGAFEGNSPIDIPLVEDENPDPDIVEYTLRDLPEGTYYFAVTAYNDDVPPLESNYSNEVTGTVTYDATPPVISNVRASKSVTTAVIEWTTDELSDSVVQYGTGSNSWGSYPSSQSNGSFVTTHSITLSGLSGSTTYYFRVGSKDVANNGPTVSNELNFTTDPVPDTFPPSIVQYPVVDHTNAFIDVIFSESNMQNTTTEANYSFSPSLLFKSPGGSDDIAPAGNSKYRLSMSPIPKFLIFTMTVSNVTDEAGNKLSPNSVTINDNDNDHMADDWEAAFGVGSPSEDPDSDGLSNLEEYDNNTDPNQADTDGDSLPDGWEVTNGLDPNDDTGINGKDGDPDGDTWTNYDEYINGYDPNNDKSPKTKGPKIKKTIPRNKSWGKNKNRLPVETSSAIRIPIDTSFAIRVQAPDGIDITDTSSIKFTVDDGINPPYERDLGDAAVVRVVKLTQDADTRVNNAWVVYDRSQDPLGNFAYDTDVNIKVDVRDKRGTIMPQESYDFNIETTAEHDMAVANRPEITNRNDAGMTILTVVNEPDLDGFQIIYDNTEPIIPLVEPLNEIPSLDLPNVTPVDRPVKLGPPNVFNNPVTLRVPVSSEGDVKDMSVYLYDGEAWVYAVSSYHTGGVIQPGGEDWVVPGSLTYDDTGTTPFLEVQVYHFSGIQAGFFFGLPSLSIDDLEAASGGCFIDTMTMGAPLNKLLASGKGYMWVLACLSLIFLLTMCAWRSRVNSEK